MRRGGVWGHQPPRGCPFAWVLGSAGLLYRSLTRLCLIGLRNLLLLLRQCRMASVAMLACDTFPCERSRSLVEITDGSQKNAVVSSDIAAHLVVSDASSLWCCPDPLVFPDPWCYPKSLVLPSSLGMPRSPAAPQIPWCCPDPLVRPKTPGAPQIPWCCPKSLVLPQTPGATLNVLTERV